MPIRKPLPYLILNVSDNQTSRSAWLEASGRHLISLITVVRQLQQVCSETFGGPIDRVYLSAQMYVKYKIPVSSKAIIKQRVEQYRIVNPGARYC